MPPPWKPHVSALRFSLPAVWRGKVDFSGYVRYIQPVFGDVIPVPDLFSHDV